MQGMGVFKFHFQNKAIKPISSQCSLFISLENIQKAIDFMMFKDGMKLGKNRLQNIMS